VELFRQSTEERLADAAQLLPREAEALHRLFFSGNGQAILLDCSDAAGERWLERVPFSPPRAIRNVLRRPPPGLRFSRDLAAKIRDSIAPRDSLSLEGLQPGRALEFQNRSLEERSLPALVRVTHSFGHGTGFFISKSGLVLTCAHVLPPVGDPIVLFRDPADGTVRSSHVRVVACDRKRDLALLQAYPRHGVPVIPVELKRTLSAGEPVTAYGMPPESETLPATAFTNGIVSAPVRLMQERTVVQTNIRAEPGASGGPLLDAHGRAVGVVSMRQLWGDMAFAVPQDDIAAFLAPYE
jgi:S1-C subfamily serine protease